MKMYLKKAICIIASLLIATSVCAAEVELYALDGNTISVDESLVDAYTAEGMGWYVEKPVTMYSLDGRTLVVPFDRVEAHKEVGWYLEEDLPKNEETPKDEPVKEEPVKEEVKPAGVRVQYTDGTIVTVPEEHFNMYIALGWIKAGNATAEVEYVTMYNADGTAKKVPANEVTNYELAGWSKNPPAMDLMTVYSYSGETKQIPKDKYEEYMAQGWYSSFEETVYAYAAFGNGADNPGAVKLLEEKKYELAFNTVNDAIAKIENSGSEYVSMLYYLRSTVTDSWREAANSPLGFINYWFTDRGSQRIVVFEYRNVSNSRIKSFEINFDICDSTGKVIEKNSASYAVSNLQLAPCDKARVGWEAKSGKSAVSVKNVKVISVTFTDGTVWRAAK